PALERKEDVDRIQERAIDAIDGDAARERGRDRRPARRADVEREARPRVSRAHAVLERGERADLVERAGEPAARQAERRAGPRRRGHTASSIFRAALATAVWAIARTSQRRIAVPS